jgi:hypothetical protein
MARRFENLPLHIKALLTRFPETGGNDDGAVNARIRALTDYARNRIGRRNNDGQFDILWHSRNGRIRPDAEHRWSLGVDGVNRSPKRVANQVPQNGASYMSSLFRCANHGDRSWFEKYVKAAVSTNRSDGAAVRINRHLHAKPLDARLAPAATRAAFEMYDCGCCCSLKLKQRAGGTIDRWGFIPAKSIQYACRWTTGR